ncbi:2-(1,2-epoxy-1,2-dihydrophenyl)acetyl-CoA isomerase PaaG [soil metagenome]
MYESIKIDKVGSVTTVTLNRPEVRNAHHLDMFNEIIDAFGKIEADPECRCAVLTGAGDVFCAGQDLAFTRQADPQAFDAYGQANAAARRRIQRNHKPVVAALNGPAIGGGVYLATSCDLIVSVDTAFLQMREIQAGNHSGGAFLFTVGRARSLEISLLGRRIPAPQAEQWGLINRSVPADQFKAAVADYVEALAELPPLAIRYTKASTNMLLDSAGFSTHIDAGSPMQRLLGLSPDGREAKRAFAEHRKPNFTGAFPKQAD